MIYISGEVRNQVGERSGFRVAYVTKSTEYGETNYEPKDALAASAIGSYSSWLKRSRVCRTSGCVK
jgi:hypothetical protein